MLKLEIKFNDAQMRAEHKYAPESIYAALDKSFRLFLFRYPIEEDSFLSDEKHDATPL